MFTCFTSIPPPPTFSPTLISLVVSVDVKHHVYLLILAGSTLQSLFTVRNTHIGLRVANRSGRPIIQSRNRLFN